LRQPARDAQFCQHGSLDLHRTAARRRVDRFFQGQEQGVAHLIVGVCPVAGADDGARIFQPAFAQDLANVLLAALLVVFAVRLAKTKKFMPSGLMLVLTILALALRNLFKD